jgi:S-adenosylmethionine hydrolase
MKILATAAILFLLANPAWSQGALVLQSDFGNKDAAVPSMKGVAVGVSADIDIYDLTHEIPVFNIWEASLRLVQTAPYWPPGTVFVSVVDPGVGTERLSVVLKTKTGHFFVSPDNGSLTAVAEDMGIAAVREIDEAVNRLKNSEMSYTFHGRDVYAYTGARLAAGVISFEQVGRELPAEVLSIPYQKASFDKGTVSGNIPVLDIQYGNIWTNIGREVFLQLGANPGDDIDVKITQGDKLIFQETMPYFRSFGAVATGETLLYLNSLNDVSLAINQGSFADQFGIQSGADWNIFLSRSQSR